MEYHKRLNKLYQNNYLPYLFNRLVAEGKQITLKKSLIPPVIHSIWFTHDDKPIELPEKYIRYATGSAKACSPKEGYQHILWVKSKKRLPQTVLRLLDSAIEIKKIGELKSSPLYSLIKKEIKHKRFGRASDIARVAIIEKYGGIYRDTDYRIYQSLTPLLLSYSFFAAREPMSSFICNAFFAAAPHHPLIQDFVRLIQRNYDPATVPTYIKNIPNEDGFATILITGPGAFTTVVAQSIGYHSGRDVILPSGYIFPTLLDAYPQKEVVREQDPVPPFSFGVHFWDSSWTTLSNFGSKG
ncbi:glycosyltransferase family 32 protein [Candidatus Odyssella thessalonicensis]|uniref:glycosyltransferase family 32 protein n=1 Tax=Candidatus Odyssella thessalonicensis TaxID=84647 RepID=UPI000225ABE5|nr:glycosyltransferase [Candidatus Odyssella thessalonicensis]